MRLLNSLHNKCEVVLYLLLIYTYKYNMGIKLLKYPYRHRIIKISSNFLNTLWNIICEM